MLSKLQQAIQQNVTAEELRVVFEAEVQDIVSSGKQQLGKLEEEMQEHQITQAKEKLNQDN